MHLGYVLLAISVIAGICFAAPERRAVGSKACAELGEFAAYTRLVGVALASKFCSSKLGPIRTLTSSTTTTVLATVQTTYSTNVVTVTLSATATATSTANAVATETSTASTTTTLTLTTTTISPATTTTTSTATLFQTSTITATATITTSTPITVLTTTTTTRASTVYTMGGAAKRDSSPVAIPGPPAFNAAISSACSCFLKRPSASPTLTITATSTSTITLSTVAQSSTTTSVTSTLTVDTTTTQIVSTTVTEVATATATLTSQSTSVATLGAVASTTSTLRITSTTTLTITTQFVASTSTITSTASTTVTSVVTQCSNPPLYGDVEPCGSGTFPTNQSYGGLSVTQEQCCFRCYSTQNCAFFLFLPSTNGNLCYLGYNSPGAPGAATAQCPNGIYSLQFNAPRSAGSSGGSPGPCGAKCN